jgi:ketosteroid isomerase-like protein
MTIKKENTMNANVEERLRTIEDEIALKKLVDTFANLADVKDFDGQMLLFTEDAIVETWFGDTLFATMKGRAKIKEVFTSFTAAFDQMFHMNGQFTASVAGNHAEALHYCSVSLIGSGDNGVKIMNSNGVIYRDDFVRTSDGWRIARRIARFVWRNAAEIRAA